MIENRPNRISNTGTVLTFQTSSVAGLAGTTTLFADATGVLRYRIGTGSVGSIGDATLAGTQTFSGVNTFSQSVQIGNTTSTSTATPLSLSLGGTLSNTAGVNPKLILQESGGVKIGIGISSGQIDFIAPTSVGYGWYINGVSQMKLTSTGRLLLGTTTDDGSNILQVSGTTKFNGNVTVTGNILPSDNTKSLGGSTRWASLEMNGGINFYGGTTYNIKPESFSTPSGVAFASTIQTANASAIVDIQSTTKGFLPPRQTQAQKNAISSPAIGLMVYQTDTVEGVYVYSSLGWRLLSWT